MDARLNREHRSRWTVALLALMLCAPIAQAASSPKSIAISSAIEQLESHAVTRAKIDGEAGKRNLTLTMTDGSTRVAEVANDDLAKLAFGAARKGHVPLSVAHYPVVKFEQPSTWDGISAGVQAWGPFVMMGLLVVVGWFAIRQVGGARFKTRIRPVNSPVRFADVAGIDEIRDEVSEIADVLRYPQRYKSVGASLPKGIILHGPPGTGKTLLAKAVAGEAGVPFFSASGSEFVEMYAGLGAKRIRTLFEAARKAAPAVVYIDEIDAVGGARTGAASSGEREQSLDQLLAEMDGFHTDPERPVVVLSSTNRLDDLDAALVRSGRFDRKIAVGLPDRSARVEILEVHMRDRPGAENLKLDDVAAFTAGLAGADLAALCNEAAFETARGARPRIELKDFRRALMRLAAGPERRGRPMLEEERRLVAYHEMGHAIVGHMLPRCDSVDRVTVIPQGQALGVTIALPSEDRFLSTRADCLERLAMLMGGRAAEELVFDEVTSGAADDLRRALSLAREMVGPLAMSEPRTVDSLRVGIGEDDTERAARQLVADAVERARDILRRQRPLLDRAAARLLEAEALEGEELDRLLGRRPRDLRLSVQDLDGVRWERRFRPNRSDVRGHEHAGAQDEGADGHDRERRLAADSLQNGPRRRKSDGHSSE